MLCFRALVFLHLAHPPHGPALTGIFFSRRAYAAGPREHNFSLRIFDSVGVHVGEPLRLAAFVFLVCRSSLDPCPRTPFFPRRPIQPAERHFPAARSGRVFGSVRPSLFQRDMCLVFPAPCCLLRPAETPPIRVMPFLCTFCFAPPPF